MKQNSQGMSVSANTIRRLTLTEAHHKENDGVQLSSIESIIAIVATGSMVHTALVTADLLSDHGINAAVIDMHTIKPLDEASLGQHLDKKLLVTLEEHSVIGGLGSAIAEYLAGTENSPRQLRLGIPQGYPHSGDYAWMLEQSGLTAEQVTARIMSTL
ncbi:transketolase C-terminal domain-containing protein [Phytobacter diazotrophicus]|uniref:transketolase C-terminal domain-containing protein n=1 Tax=Phytobacter diazotrophicus TaxID=395631 RepID=UPI0013EDE1F3|nr:transketolase C-terminal domain-containing protein [Phytobacter diazotrophicus]MDU7133239.1 transketolase C-terminal domain-containing protein [Enterobacteriaceae bacterium]QIH62897.1 hypothetical protein CRX67_07040 [Enterobacteriaceae bacterium A-F18]